MIREPHEPAPLPDHARAWLDHYAAVHTMPRDRFVRTGRAIHAETPHARVDRRAWILGGLLVAASIAAVWASGLLGGHELVADSTGAHGLVEDRAASGDVQRTVSREDAAPIPAPAELPAVAPQVAAPAMQGAASTRMPAAAPPKSSPTRPSPNAASTLADERALLEGAWRALANGDHADATAIARRHRTLFPAGQLDDVRDAIEAIVRCGASPAADRVGVCAAYDRAHPHAIARAQVEDACRATK